MQSNGYFFPFIIAVAFPSSFIGKFRLLPFFPLELLRPHLFASHRLLNIWPDCRLADPLEKVSVDLCGVGDGGRRQTSLREPYGNKLRSSVLVELDEQTKRDAEMKCWGKET